MKTFLFPYVKSLLYSTNTAFPLFISESAIPIYSNKVLIFYYLQAITLEPLSPKSEQCFIVF